MKINKTEFKALVEEAIEKAKFVKSVEVGGDNKFPFMSLNDGVLTVDKVTWFFGGAFLPGAASYGVTKFVIPAVIGSFTGVTQLAIVVFILINLAQTKFGKPVEVSEEGQKVQGVDAGIIEYLNQGLWEMTVDYTVGRALSDFVRGHVTFLNRTKPVQVAE